MLVYTILGIFVLAMVIGAGVFWLMTNITFISSSEKYTYKKNNDGIESVIDHDENKKQ